MGNAHTFLLEGYTNRQGTIEPSDFRWEMTKALLHIYNQRADCLVVGKVGTVRGACAAVFTDMYVSGAEAAYQGLCEKVGIDFTYVRRQARSLFRYALTTVPVSEYERNRENVCN